MNSLRKYWFRFESLPRPTVVNLGCGVTTYTRDDALNLLREHVFGPNGPPTIVECIEDVELHQIERKHSCPNIGDTQCRGIWFPQGYPPG
jgi:hypothetical protein